CCCAVLCRSARPNRDYQCDTPVRFGEWLQFGFDRYPRRQQATGDRRLAPGNGGLGPISVRGCASAVVWREEQHCDGCVLMCSAGGTYLAVSLFPKKNRVNRFTRHRTGLAAADMAILVAF